MSIKKLASAFFIAAIALMVACKSKPKDADIQAEVKKSIMAPAVNADVKDGVVTLSGEVQSETEKADAESSAKTVKGVASVVNNITVAAPPPVAAPVEQPVAVTADDALTKSVADVVKDFPGISATVKDGVISVTGETSADKWKRLKMALDNLKPKKVDASGLKIK